MRPDAGVKVRLKLNTDAHAVGIGLAHAGHLAVRLVQRAQQVLHVVAHLMRNHIGVGKVAIGPELLLHAGEEGEVDIEFFVGRAVERPHGGLALPAGSAGGAGIKHQRGGFIRAYPIVHEIVAPNVFRRGKDLAGEFGQGLILCRGLIGSLCRRLHAAGRGNIPEHIAQVPAH